ncbi:DUF3427 domain-containing protein [Clostridiales bacterium FE2011]|nr:DUF3427 domain-containing protein [Clostridiales bacterium FE2011]
MMKPGLYEQIISKAISDELSSIPDVYKAIEKLDVEEAPQALAEYVAEAMRRTLESIPKDTEEQIALVNKVLSVLSENREDLSGSIVDNRAEKLLHLLDKNSPERIAGKIASDITRPETPMSVSSLFTGAAHEPKMFSEIKKEIASSDRIDMLVSFIKWSGLRLIIDELREFTNRGGLLRVITTSYMGATEVKAIDELSKLLNTEIKISYDTARTRLHAKTYVFYRDTGFTTAYIGSSNLSNAAMSNGLEWNLKITAIDQPDTLKKIYATFDSYWNSYEFESYTTDSHPRLAEALKGEKWNGDKQFFLFDIRPYPYQQAILDQLRAEREVHGFNRNLLVAATGTGKTVISALDYRGWRKAHPLQLNRLLFIAHREEILKQSIATFQAVLKDPNFGELWVGNYKADNLDYLFISVQTLNSQALWKRLPANYYDYIIVDETHHAAADSYADAIETFKPQVLLGLTATPERMDGKSILHFFDNRIAAEIRLPEAINRKLLCPFQYFGVSDTVDLNDLKWTRGGYDHKELNNIYTLSGSIAQKRADHVVECLSRYVTDIDEVKALGFCVSIQHARFMAEHFNIAGIPSLALDSFSSDEERRNAQKKLVNGDIHVIFVVDLYNEGVDIPEVNTVLFLRPTESLTIFLQQLGRGLRLCDGKDCLTVLDFIGAANRRYNFEEKFAALLDDEHHTVVEEIDRGFTGAPKGCYIQLEKKASRIVLDNIQQYFRGHAELVNRIRTYHEDSGQELSFEGFLSWYHMTPADIYKKGITFARLCVEANVQEDFHEEIELLLSKIMYRFTVFDSRRWIQFLLDILPNLGKVNIASLSLLEQRMMQMFYITVWDSYAEDWNSYEVQEKLLSLANSPVMLKELLDLLKYQFDHIDFIDSATDLGFDCPLDVHCTYTQRQLLAALDYKNYSAMRQGVLYLPAKNIDVFLITLNKSDKDYSPTTMYEDYAISNTQFHWQSQSTTSAESPTGQRYIHHAEHGGHILLFVREFKKDILGTSPYTFLGQASYVSHHGSKPMSIIWQLEKPIPGKYLRRVQQVMG